jgi:hypothetical protein
MSAMPSPTGRWGGAVTSRPLPEGDLLSDTPTATRRELARIWLSQAATELRVAKSFALVHDALQKLGADRGLVQIAARAVDDEHRHHALCRTMAERYLGAPVADTPALPFAPPLHAAAKSDDERRALWVVGQCAFNETFAGAYLSLCLDRAEHPLARAAIRELLSDEIDHARIGWAYLDALDSGTARAVESWLLPLAVCNLREWRAVRLAEDERLAQHGVPPAGEVERALLDALCGIIVPGLSHVGMNAKPIEDWLRRGAPT